MESELVVGPRTLADGAKFTQRGDKTGATMTADTHGRYQEAVLRGNVYFLGGVAAAPTAYVGAAGGTPLLAVHNPTGSNFNLVLLVASAAARVVASATGHTEIALWVGASVTPTGTQTSPKSALTFASGGVGLGFANTALTASTALNFGLSLISYFWGTTVGVGVSPSLLDLGGLIVLAPGMQMALGAIVAPASLTWDASLWWEQVPV